MKKRPLTCLVILTLTVYSQSVEAQSSSGLLYDTSTSEASTPATTRERLANAVARQSQAQSEMLTLFNGLVTEPNNISTKETVHAIDQGDRNLKSAKAAFDSILSSLRADLKKIKEDGYFTDEQKTELIGNIDAMAKQCEDASQQAAASIKILSKSYRLMPEWRKGYRTYQNLDGEAKATEHLKAAVDIYMKELTAKPETEKTAEEDAGAALAE